MAFLCAIILNYHSISTLESKAIGIKNLFKLFVSFLKDTDSLDVKSSLLMAQKKDG
jgi:hypothetical protein